MSYMDANEKQSRDAILRILHPTVRDKMNSASERMSKTSAIVA